MQANTPWEMLPSRQRTRSAPRNSTRFAAQYSARGLPCERFTAVLADRTSCITRGRGGWLDLPRGGLAPPILLPAFLAHSPLGQTAPSSFVTAAAGLAPIADVPGGDSDPPITTPVRPVSIRLRKRRRAAQPVRSRRCDFQV